MRRPTLSDYRPLAERGLAVPVTVELPADLDTPLSAYLKLGGEGFILESCHGGERFGRYSVVGARAAAVLRLDAEGGVLRGRGGEAERFGGGPLAAFRSVVERSAVAALPGEPPFVGGCVGYLGYGAARWFEARVPDRHPETTGFHDAEWLVYDDYAVFDTRGGVVRATAIARPDRHASVDAALADAAERAARLAALLDRPLETGAYRRAPSPPHAPLVGRALWERASFERAVARAREYIHAGDCMQVVLARAFEARPTPPPLALYRALRRINPSPYLFLINFDEGRALVGSSPELLVRARDGEVVVRPIAGTRPRGETEDDDVSLERELVGDAKELAEHVMLVDLGRNDIGRVAAPGTVRVEESRVVERYSHVMHMVSQVAGRLAPGRDALDALAAAFPAGTLSGAPKIRAMQIIDELEPARRGPYGGGVGYVSFNGTADLAIAIRTFFVDGERVRWQSGAGIVADSVPEREADETEHKARAMAAALAAANAEVPA